MLGTPQNAFWKLFEKIIFSPLNIQGENGKNGKMSDELLYSALCAKSDGRKAFIKQLQMSNYRLLCQLGRAEPHMQTLWDENQRLLNEVIALKDKEHAEIIFITINPRDDVPFEEFKSCMEKISRKKWLKRFLYVFEQRGTTPDTAGFRPHGHLIVYRDGKKPSQVIREISNTVKHITNVEHDEIFNIRFVNEDDENVKRVFNYVLGTKASEDKHEKQEMDIIWRTKIGIKKFYSKGIDGILPN